jgi:hypothetical protein
MPGESWTGHHWVSQCTTAPAERLQDLELAAEKTTSGAAALKYRGVREMVFLLLGDDPVSLPSLLLFYNAIVGPELQRRDTRDLRESLLAGRYALFRCAFGTLPLDLTSVSSSGLSTFARHALPVVVWPLHGVWMVSLLHKVDVHSAAGIAVPLSSLTAALAPQPNTSSSPSLDQPLLQRLLASLTSEWDRRALVAALSLALHDPQLTTLGRRPARDRATAAAVLMVLDSIDSISAGAGAQAVQKVERARASLQLRIEENEALVLRLSSYADRAVLTSLEEERKTLVSRLQRQRDLLQEEGPGLGRIAKYLARAAVEASSIRRRAEGQGAPRKISHEVEEEFVKRLESTSYNHGRRKDMVGYTDSRDKYRSMKDELNKGKCFLCASLWFQSVSLCRLFLIRSEPVCSLSLSVAVLESRGLPLVSSVMTLHNRAKPVRAGTRQGETRTHTHTLSTHNRTLGSHLCASPCRSGDTVSSTHSTEAEPRTRRRPFSASGCLAVASNTTSLTYRVPRSLSLSLSPLPLPLLLQLLVTSVLAYSVQGSLQRPRT